MTYAFVPDEEELDIEEDEIIIAESNIADGLSFDDSSDESDEDMDDDDEGEQQDTVNSLAGDTNIVEIAEL